MLAASFAYGQNPPQITVSTEKVNVSGEVMYVHKVKGKETLYSIAKAYNVTIDDIVRKNEHLKAGLKEGSVIYIPSKGTATSDLQERATAEPPAAVQESVPQEAAQQVESSAPQGWKLTPANIKKYSKKKHTVKWYEKLEDIAAKYKVSVEDIVAFNALETTQVKKKQVLYIPNNEFLAMAAANKAAADTDVQETVVAEEKPQKPELPQIDTGLERITEITYILPLALKDTLGPNPNFTDFYAGALLAVNERGWKNTGINLIDQHMYSSIDAVIESGVLDAKPGTTGPRAFIGPIASADLAKVVRYAGENAFVISPLDQSSEPLVAGNPSFIHMPPAADAGQKNIIKLFADKCNSGNNAVIMYEKGGIDSTLLKNARELLSAKGINYSEFSYGILEGREILIKMNPLMKPEMANLVLVLSNSEAFVSDVVRNLNLIHTNPLEENRRSITLFGLPRWRNFERIEVDYFHRMNLHLSLPYFVDYSRPNVKDFLLKYRALYNSEPTPFAFQGYDVTWMIYALMGEGHPSLTHYSGTLEGNDNLIQNCSLQLNKEESDGFLNSGTTNIMYNPDYTISVIKQ